MRHRLRRSVNIHDLRTSAAAIAVRLTSTEGGVDHLKQVS